MDWIKVRDEKPPTNEPVVYCRPSSTGNTPWHVGVAYWTVSKKWNPEAESTKNPDGFSHWIPLPESPRKVG